MVEGVFGSLMQAIPVTFNLMNILLLSLGVLLGLLVGLIPGLGAMVGMSLVLPLIWFMSPEKGLLVLLGINSAVMTGGSITAILVGIPGAATNAATVLDGYPMTQRGEGARAVGASLCSSGVGGVLSVVFACAMIFLVVPLVLIMKSPELTLLIVIGLSFMAGGVGSSGAKTKNLIAGMVGILVSLIGIQSTTGALRYTFGVPYLFSGIDLVVLCLGIFGLGEIMDVFLKGETSITTAEMAKVRMKDLLEGFKDTFRHWWLTLRCSVIGYLLGVLPGIGGMIGVFLAYGFGKKVSKRPEEWGKGCVEGVIAPESSNNAVVGGATLTTLAFGIPGSSPMALVLATFLVYGIIPGRPLITEKLPLVFIILLGIAVANVLAVLFCMPLVSPLAKLTTAQFKYLFSIILVLVTVGAFATTLKIADIIILIPIGILGVCMKRFDYSLPCFLLGFVLGPIFESYMWLSYKVYGPTFMFSSPIAILLTLVIAAWFASALFKGTISKRLKKIKEMKL